MKNKTHVIILLCLLAFSVNAEAETITGPYLLQQYMEHQVIPVYSMEVDFALFEEQEGKLSKSLTKEFVTNKSGSKYDIRSVSYNIYKGQPMPPMEVRAIWDDERYYHRQFTEGHSPDAFLAAFSHKQYHMHGQFSSSASDSFLNGFFMSDQTFAQKLIANPAIKVKEHRVDIDGHLCYELTATTDEGNYTVWIDPEAGYAFRKAQVTKTAGDILWGQPMPYNIARRGSSITDVVYTIDAIVIEEIDGRYIPVSGQVLETRIYCDGSQEPIKRRASRHNIQLTPHFDKTGAFVMDGIPEGTRVSHLDFPAAHYEWRHGTVQPRVDVEFLNVIENEMSHVKSQADLPYTDAGREKDASACCDGHEADIDHGRDAAGSSREDSEIRSPSNTGLIMGLSVAVVLGVAFAGGVVYRWRSQQDA